MKKETVIDQIMPIPKIFKRIRRHDFWQKHSFENQAIITWFDVNKNPCERRFIDYDLNTECGFLLPTYIPYRTNEVLFYFGIRGNPRIRILVGKVT